MYEVLILLVLVNLGFTSYIWQTVRRGPKRKFLGKLLNGKPITPNHTPSSLRNGIELRITDEDRRFFSDFEMFADATLDCCRLAKSTGSFLLSLTSRHQEMQKKLSG